MADWHDIHLEDSRAVVCTAMDDPMSDDDFEALDYEDCTTGSDSEDEGWIMYGSNSNNKSQHAETSQALSNQLKSRGSPDVLRKRGILKEREQASHYYVNSCPGASLSNLKGTSIYCPKTQGKRGSMESQRAKMLRLIMERSFNAFKRPTKKETYAENAYIVGSGPGKVLNNGYKEKTAHKEISTTPKLPTGRNYVNSGPGIQTRNYYVNSGPGIQTGGKTKGNYTVGCCPGRELKKPKRSTVDNGASAAYRQAYQVFTPSASKIRALEKGLLKAMQSSCDPRAKQKQLARHLTRSRVQLQLERARHARIRALEMTEKSIRAEDRNQQLRQAFTAIQGIKYSPPAERKPTSTVMSPVKVPPTTFYADLEEGRHEPTEVVRRVVSRDDLLRQAFAAEARVKAAQETVKNFAIGGRLGSGSGIVIRDEKGRDDLLRQAFAAEARVKAAQETVKNFAIGGRLGSGSGMIVEDEKTSNRDSLLRQACIGGGSKMDAARLGVITSAPTVPTEPTVFLGNRKAKRKLKKKLGKKKKGKC